MEETLQETQRETVDVLAAAQRRATITLLAHPDAARVGEIHWPNVPAGRGGALVLSRHEPPFFSPRGGASSPRRPIDDRYTSRKPLRLQWDANDGVELSVDDEGPRVKVNGHSLANRVSFGVDEVRQGIVVELGTRVVVLIHLSDGRAPALHTHGIVGESDGIQDVRHDIDKWAELKDTVLIRGESGVGKELVAQAIHEASHRAGKLIDVNMAALPKGTETSAFFGHVKGAFTGAHRDHPGYMGAAQGGTLFLDEVAETPSEVQAMLLRVLQEWNYQPVGSARSVQADVRLLSATDAKLEAAIEDGRFKLPLFHRLARVEIKVKPLRERKDDIGRLLVHFLRQELAEFGQSHRLEPPQDGEKPWLPAWLVAQMALYPWPGNVRQLYNRARQLVIGSRGLDQARPSASLLEELQAAVVLDDENNVDERPDTDLPNLEPSTVSPMARRPKTIEEDELVALFEKHEYGIGATAKALGWARGTLYKRIHESERMRVAGDLELDEIEDALKAHPQCVEDVAAALKVSARGLRQRMKQLDLKDS